MFENGKACCFSGHRPAKLPWKYDERDIRCIEFKEKLAAVISAIYESGITHFICGMALGCDLYCAEAVLELRKAHPEITLEAAIPFAGQADGWGESSRRRYDRILAACVRVNVMQEKYAPGCMQKRNRYMVDHSAVLLACYNGEAGGTWSTIKYAEKRDIEVIELPIE